MSGKDLGTYHVRAVMEDGSGFILHWPTSRRYTHGSASCHPLNADAMPPPWESEEELFGTMEFMFNEGNYSCDCNKRMMIAQAAQQECYKDKCGDTIKLKSLTVIRPDGTEHELKC